LYQTKVLGNGVTVDFFAQGGGSLKICSGNVTEGEFQVCGGLKVKAGFNALVVGLEGMGALKGCWSSKHGAYAVFQYAGTYTAKGIFRDDTVRYGGNLCLRGDCYNDHIIGDT
jgi:hypothetical protein